MALAQTAFKSQQYEDFPNYWLKFYEQGTTTPLSMATDSTGTTTLARAEISAGGVVPVGFIKTAGDAIFIPWVDGNYDGWLFPTAAEADANDTTNATRIADNINADPADAITSANKLNIVVDNIADMKAIEFLLDDALVTVRGYLTPGDNQARVYRYDAGGVGSENRGTIFTLDTLVGLFVAEFLDINVKDFGATGDGATDDAAAIRSVITAISPDFDSSAQPFTLFFPKGNYKILSTIEIPPGVNLLGVGIYNGTNLNSSSIINVQFDGVGIRFIRKAAATTLTHNGGAEKIVFSGLGGSATTAQRLVELGDSGNIDINNGAWNGVIRHCGFNFTDGYGILSVHSQEWLIQHNFFKSVKRGVYYTSVAASAKIISNSFDSSAAGRQDFPVVLLSGTLGGSAGAIITDNYMISPLIGIWLSNQIGTVVHNNTIEGAKREAISLNRTDENGVPDANLVGVLNGCTAFNIDANTFINWGADGAGQFAIELGFSRSGYIGNQAYMSPNASSGGCIRLTTDATDPTQRNVIVEPEVRGANLAVVPPWDSTDPVWFDQTMWRRDGIQLGDNSFAGAGGRGVSHRGHIFATTNDNILYWNGTAADIVLKSEGALAGTAGAVSVYATVDISGVKYKVPLHLI